MRLTLRTMLAYLDDVLDPSEAQQIGKKIEEVETAANLVHRIRDAVQRPGLPAPKLGGRAVDPNTVAEYLDNTLAADRVVDFEKICLVDDADVYLAEVASCHQALAAILGDPAEVDPRSRVRMYKLLAEYDARLEQAAEQAESAAGNGAKNGSVAPAAASAAVGEADQPAGASPPPAPTSDDPAENAPQPRKKPEVPQYLREPGIASRLWRIAAIVMLGLLLVVVALMAVGPQWLNNMLGRAPQVAQNQVNDSQQPIDQVRGSATPQDTSGDPATRGQATDATTTPATTIPVDPTADQASPVSPGTRPAANDGTPRLPDAPETAPSPGVSPVPAAPTAPETVPSVEPAPPAPEVGSVPSPALPMSGFPASGLPSPSVPTVPPGNPSAVPSVPPLPPGPGTSPVPAPTTVAGSTPSVPDPETRPPAEQWGMLNSQQTALFRRSTGTQDWQLVPGRGSVYSGDLLISPPAYRNVLLLRDFAVHLRGDTLVQVGIDDGLPKISVYYGRIEVLASDADTRMIIKAGDQPAAMVTFTKPASGLAIDCDPIRQAGQNPELEPPRYSVEIFASAGQFTWDGGQAPAVHQLEAKSRYVLGTEFKLPLSADLPEWISSDEEKRLIMRQSAEQLAAELQLLPKIRLEQRLEELAYDGGAKVELRSLARRSLVSLDRFQPALDALRKYDRSVERSPQFWPDYLDSLQKAVARNRQSAKGLREALVSLRGEDKGQELFRMFWGYTHEQLAAGEGQKLVAYLTHPDTDFRVLAEWNLNRLMNINARPSTIPHDGDASRIKPYVEGLRRKIEAAIAAGPAAIGTISPEPATPAEPSAEDQP